MRAFNLSSNSFFKYELKILGLSWNFEFELKKKIELKKLRLRENFEFEFKRASRNQAQFSSDLMVAYWALVPIFLWSKGF